jgi:hypothetical protein
MTSNRAQYGSGFVSSRSRRLRTIAALFLLVIVAMAVYGTRVLVPGINRVAAIAVKPAVHPQGNLVSPIPRRNTVTPLNVSKKEARILKFDVMFVAAYWVVWIVLILSLLLVVWMDLREVSRNYLDQRRELWSVALKEASAGATNRDVGAEPNPKTNNSDGKSGPSVDS